MKGAIAMLVLSIHAASHVARGAEKITVPGDVVFGGLFPMHEQGYAGVARASRLDHRCGEIKREKGIQRLEAMLYAIDLINNNTELLPGLMIGAHILDTCSQDTYALEQTMDFVSSHISADLDTFKCDDGEFARPMGSLRPVVGIIGAASSSVSMMVASVLRLFKIPQISYASTSTELSDRTRFEFFSRVVPPDSYQSQAMVMQQQPQRNCLSHAVQVDIVLAMGWTYVATLADEGNYGEKGIAYFVEKALKTGTLCIAVRLIIPRSATDEKLVDLVHEISSCKAKAVVMFVNEDNTRRLLDVVERKGLTGRFIWIASDSWGTKEAPVRNHEVTALGAITVLPKRKVLKGFDRYFTNLNPRNNRRNVWFTEFWERHFGCIVRNTSGNWRDTNETYSFCKGNESLIMEKPKQFCSRLDYYDRESCVTVTRQHVQEGMVQFVVDSVLSLAHALHNYLKANCPKESDMSKCHILRTEHVNGTQLLEFIRSGGNVVSFSDGDGIDRYDIYQYQRVHRGYSYVPIGDWVNRLSLDTSALLWPERNHSVPIDDEEAISFRTEIPESVCSKPCKLGEKRSGGKLNQRVCCWSCIGCDPFDRVVDDYTCAPCPNGFKPDETRRLCLPISATVQRWTEPLVLIPVIFSALGIFVALFVVVVFVKYNTTPIIKASGRELCYVLLVGIIYCFLVTFLLFAPPSLIVCGLKRFSIGLSMSICYAALFTKTNRLSRIFNRGIKMMFKKPSYTSPRSQLVICGSLVTVQAVAACTWIGMEIPEAVPWYPDRGTLIVRCKAGDMAIAVFSLLYNIILITLCTVYAVKTRGVPENYNETKYIAFCMYSTCIVWLSFLPIYFIMKNNIQIQTTALSMAISISAWAALGLLFIPKVYIVLFRPDKNVHTKISTIRSPKAKILNSEPQPVAGNFLSPTGFAFMITRSSKEPPCSQCGQEIHRGGGQRRPSALPTVAADGHTMATSVVEEVKGEAVGKMVGEDKSVQVRRRDLESGGCSDLSTHDIDSTDITEAVLSEMTNFDVSLLPDTEHSVNSLLADTMPLHRHDEADITRRLLAGDSFDCSSLPRDNSPEPLDVDLDVKTAGKAVPFEPTGSRFWSDADTSSEAVSGFEMRNGAKIRVVSNNVREPAAAKPLKSPTRRRQKPYATTSPRRARSSPRSPMLIQFRPAAENGPQWAALPRNPCKICDAPTAKFCDCESALKDMPRLHSTNV